MAERLGERLCEDHPRPIVRRLLRSERFKALFDVAESGQCVGERALLR